MAKSKSKSKPRCATSVTPVHDCATPTAIGCASSARIWASTTRPRPRGGWPLDVEEDDEGLAWWGRPLDTLERETMLAEVRAHYGEVPEQDGPQRWLRGRIHQRDGGFEVEVNSRERFERLLEIFRELGAQPRISRKLVFDPAEDLPALRRGPLFPFAASPESNAAWCEHWPDTPLPALGGRTPRQAARRERDQPPLEALLRELEHDADLMARRGLEVPDVGGLRRALQMPAEAWMG